MTEKRLARVHKGCVLREEYCDERDYGCGCEKCRYYDWIIDKIIDEQTDLL